MKYVILVRMRDGHHESVVLTGEEAKKLWEDLMWRSNIRLLLAYQHQHVDVCVRLYNEA